MQVAKICFDMPQALLLYVRGGKGIEDAVIPKKVGLKELKNLFLEHIGPKCRVVIVTVYGLKITDTVEEVEDLTPSQTVMLEYYSKKTLKRFWYKKEEH